MRLTSHQIETFKHLAGEVFGSQTRLMLFGSRVDERRSGGDIDLYVVGFSGTIQQGVDAKLRFLSKAKLELGEQRIDVVFSPTEGQPRLPIHQFAERTGVLL